MAGFKKDFLRVNKNSVIGDGKLTVPSHVNITGFVNMNIECAGTVVVEHTGKVQGNIKATEVFILGEVSGGIVADEGLTICESGSVKGKIASRKLVIKEGAKCNFSMSVGEHFHTSPLQNGTVKNTNTIPLDMSMNENATYSGSAM